MLSKYFLRFSWEFTFFSCKFHKLTIWSGRRNRSKVRQVVKILNDPYNWQTRVTIVSKHFRFRSDPIAHKVFAVTKQLQRKLGSHFLQTHLLDNLTEDVIDDENNYLPSEDIFLSLVARNLLGKKVEDGDMWVGQHDRFINPTIAFYRESLRYTLLKINVGSSS